MNLKDLQINIPNYYSHPTIEKAIRNICNKDGKVAQFLLDENGNIIEWYNKTVEQPTKEEIEEELVNVEKEKLLNILSEKFASVVKRPKVPTSLGFTVDGGREDLQNFELGKKYQIEFIVDANDNPHQIDPATYYDTIISEIELYGIGLWQKKQQKKAEINALTTIEDIHTYEKEQLNEW